MWTWDVGSRVSVERRERAEGAGVVAAEDGAEGPADLVVVLNEGGPELIAAHPPRGAGVLIEGGEEGGGELASGVGGVGGVVDGVDGDGGVVLGVEVGELGEVAGEVEVAAAGADGVELGGDAGLAGAEVGQRLQQGAAVGGGGVEQVELRSQSSG